VTPFTLQGNVLPGAVDVAGGYPRADWVPAGVGFYKRAGLVGDGTPEAF
jgi:hypothetical protein